MSESPVNKEVNVPLIAVLTLLVCQIAPLIFLAFAFGVFEPYDLHPTYAEFADHGYYLYVVPPSIVAEYGWREETAFWRWGKHCSISQDNRSNPLAVNYFDKDDRIVFRIELTQWGSVMDWRDRKERIPLPFDPKWAKAGTLEMIARPDQDRQMIYYEDWYGTPVYVTSNLPLVETLTLLHILNYEGAPQAEAAPWKTC